jgi:S1-C subfamily serine protease
VSNSNRAASLLTNTGLAVALGFLGTTTWANAQREEALRLRIAQLETEVATDSARDVSFEHDLKGLGEGFRALRAELSETSRRAVETGPLRERLRTAEARLGSIGHAIDAQANSLNSLVQASAEFGPDVLEEELRRRDERVEAGWNELSHMLDGLRRSTDESLDQIKRIDEAVAAERDVSTMWHELVGPVVQIAGDVSVGSGVRLSSQRVEDEADGTAAWRTYVLTSWHVVRDLDEDPVDATTPIPIYVYDVDGNIEEVTGHLVARNVDLDSALLVIESDAAFAAGAKLAPRSVIDDVRIFDRVYAVGCPLGNDPVPTPGEISTNRHDVDGDEYWMINASTYIGNSGGGIFDADTHELLGIFSKIYTHGSLRPTIVPHMGLVSPLDDLYDWLEGSGFGEIVPPDPARAVASSEN